MTEIEKIQEALQSADPQKNVNNVCRSILDYRLLHDTFNDNNVRTICRDMVKTLRFPLEYCFQKQMKKKEPRDVQSLSSKPRTFFKYGAVALLGVTLAVASNHIKSKPKAHFVNIVGICMAAASAFYGGGQYSRLQIDNPIDTSSEKLVVKTTAEDVLRMVEETYRMLKPLSEFNQMEGRYSSVLDWLQQQYRTKDKAMKDNIVRLMEDIGFEFVDYSPDLQDHFNYQNANVQETTTTLYAVRNVSSGIFVCKGLVLSPLEA